MRLNQQASDIVINWAGGLHHAKKSEASGFCSGYIISALDTALTFSSIGLLEKKICPTENISLQQLELVVVKYLNDNPAHLNEAADSLAPTALMEAFPCPGTNRQ